MHTFVVDVDPGLVLGGNACRTTNSVAIELSATTPEDDTPSITPTANAAVDQTRPEK